MQKRYISGLGLQKHYISTPTYTVTGLRNHGVTDRGGAGMPGYRIFTRELSSKHYMRGTVRSEKELFLQLQDRTEGVFTITEATLFEYDKEKNEQTYLQFLKRQNRGNVYSFIFENRFTTLFI